MTQKRSVLITGASRGLGYELHRLYLENGWITFPLVRQKSIATTLDRQSYRCYPIVADLAFDGCSSKIAQVVSQRIGHLDLLINNAGFSGSINVMSDVTPKEVLDLLQVHCLGVIRCTRAVLPLLRASGTAKIVNVTSRLGSMSRNASGEFAGQPFSYSYRIAKAAQNMFTLCLGEELIKEGIAVYGVHPGQLLTASAPPDADTYADVAAQRLVSWIENADETMVGHCVDLENEEMPW